MSNIDNLTFGEMKQVAEMMNCGSSKSKGLSKMVGKKVIVRTYSAGVWFGEIAEKDGNEVIVKTPGACGNGVLLSQLAYLL